MKKQLLIYGLIFLFLLSATAFVVSYGRGYQFGFLGGKPTFSGTGLLVVTSSPDGAQVFIDGHLTTATNNTLNLLPGDYDVKIYKEGYFPWEKKIKVQTEVVSKAESVLFPQAPKLENITTTGVANPTLDPSETKIAYTVASQSAQKNGIYTYDMTTRSILSLQAAATHLTDDTTAAFSLSSLSWTPDGKYIIASVSAAPATPETTATYLLPATSFTQAPQDVTATLPTLQEQWKKDESDKLASRINTQPITLQQFINNDIKVIAWSPLPAESKILYQATTSATLPIIISPRLIGTDSTPEERTIQKGNIYVYDTKEDRNYKIPAVVPKTYHNSHPYPLFWLADGDHLVYVHEGKISIIDYDGLNQTTIFAGPFIDNYVFPWPTASRIVILTNFNNNDVVPNLYTIDLK